MTAGPGKGRHSLIDGDDYIGDIETTEETKQFFKAPIASIKQASYEGTLQALSERGITGYRTHNI